MSLKKHSIIYIPGLNDQNFIQKKLCKILPLIWKPEFNLVIFEPHWQDRNQLEPKLKELIALIDTLYKNGSYVSLMGQSAGGSLALNAFTKRKTIIHKVINVTGRLKAGENVRPSLQFASRLSPAFKESVLLFENENEKKLLDRDRRRILTLRPFFDAIVPASTVPVKGATNKIIPVAGHSMGGIAAITLLKERILNFIQK